MFHSRLVIVASFLLACWAFASHAPAQEEDASKNPIVIELDRRVEQFLDGVSEGDQDSAFAGLLLGSQLLEQEDEYEALVEASKQIENRYGAYRDSEQVSAKRIGVDLVLLKYLFKCERFPVIWYVAFYRHTRTATSGSDWVVISLSFDTQVERLFD
jgi:hypothetical protein